MSHRASSIAFITEPSAVRQILARLAVATQPPRIAPARGLPLWEAVTTAAANNDPAWDHTPPPAPAVDFDQRITGCGTTPAARWVRFGARCSERRISAHFGSERDQVRRVRAGAPQPAALRADRKTKSSFAPGLHAQQHLAFGL